MPAALSCPMVHLLHWSRAQTVVCDNNSQFKVAATASERGVREGEMKMKTLQTPSPASLSSLSLSLSDLLQSRAVAGWKLQPNPLSIKQMPAMFVLDMQHNPRWRRSTPARTATVHWD